MQPADLNNVAVPRLPARRNLLSRYALGGHITPGHHGDGRARCIDHVPSKLLGTSSTKNRTAPPTLVIGPAVHDTATVFHAWLARRHRTLERPRGCHDRKHWKPCTGARTRRARSDTCVAIHIPSCLSASMCMVGNNGQRANKEALIGIVSNILFLADPYMQIPSAALS